MKKAIKILLFGIITFVTGFVAGICASELLPDFMDDHDFSDIREQEED